MLWYQHKQRISRGAWSVTPFRQRKLFQAQHESQKYHRHLNLLSSCVSEAQLIFFFRNLVNLFGEKSIFDYTNATQTSQKKILGSQNSQKLPPTFCDNTTKYSMRSMNEKKKREISKTCRKNVLKMSFGLYTSTIFHGCYTHPRAF